MVGEHRLNSVIKTVKISDITVPAGQSLDGHGIVFVGDRVGVVYDKINDTQVSVNFDTQREFITDLFDSSALPKIGGKIYIGASDGKLTKTESGNKLVGYYWGEIGSHIAFSLAM